MPNHATYAPCALTVAGSDSGAGAGIQADLKAFCAHGVFGATVITLVTAQNTHSVTHLEMVPEGSVKAQLEAVFSDFNVTAAKTGALGTAQMIKLVSGFLAKKSCQLVVDPVMISKHGHVLIEASAINALVANLLPLATIVTPNIPEAEKLAGMAKIDSRARMVEAAKAIASLGPGTVVIKGGHSTGTPADLVYSSGEETWLEAERVDSPHTHGTGCTFSASITANLVKGMRPLEAVSAAKEYITGAIAHANVFGKGINTVNPFWKANAGFGTDLN